MRKRIALITADSLVQSQQVCPLMAQSGYAISQCSCDIPKLRDIALEHGLTVCCNNNECLVRKCSNAHPIMFNNHLENPITVVECLTARGQEVPFAEIANIFH